MFTTVDPLLTRDGPATLPTLSPPEGVRITQRRAAQEREGSAGGIGWIGGLPTGHRPADWGARGNGRRRKCRVAKMSITSPLLCDHDNRAAVGGDSLTHRKPTT